MGSGMAAKQGSMVIDGDIPVAVKRSSRARRMTLRVVRAGGDVVLTLPERVPLAEGRAFAQSRAGWLRRMRESLPAIAVVRHGVQLPVGGLPVLVTPAKGRLVRLEAGRLLVPEGRPAGVVVAAWLKQRARSALAQACDRHAQVLGRPFAALALRDTRSRWGSCTHDGRLMFSWRLAMAPPEVLDYVAAHEVAHLRHMDHSAAFWACCEQLKPGYAPLRQWLREHGHELQAWDFSAGDALPVASGIDGAGGL